MKTSAFIIGLSIVTYLSACNNSNKAISASQTDKGDSLQAYVAERLPIYEKVKLTTDLSQLSESERKMLPLLIQAAQIMDELFWKQTYPQRDSLLNAVKDEKTKEFI